MYPCLCPQPKSGIHLAWFKQSITPNWTKLWQGVGYINFITLYFYTLTILSTIGWEVSGHHGLFNMFVPPILEMGGASIFL